MFSAYTYTLMSSSVLMLLIRIVYAYNPLVKKFFGFYYEYVFSLNQGAYTYEDLEVISQLDN